METKAFRWQNWFGNLSCVADLYQPGDLDQLRQAVASAAGKGRVRALGSGCAWSPLVPVPGSLVSLAQLRRIERVGSPDAAPRVRVQSGVTIRELTNWTTANALELISPTVFQDLSIGGAIAVGAHGTGRDWSTLSDAVTAMTLIDAAGNVIELSEERDGDLLDAARVALGAFGVIYDVTLRCERAFNVQVEDRWMPTQEVLAGLDDLVRTYEFVELYWFPFDDRMWIKVMNRTDQVASAPRGVVTEQPLRDAATVTLGNYLWPIVAQRLPWLTRKTVRLQPLFVMHQGVRVEPAAKAFHYQHAYPLCWDMSWAVPLSDAARAWSNTMELVEEFGRRGQYPVNMVVHSRFLGGSKAWLAPAHDRPVCDLEVVTIKGTPDTDSFFTAFADAMLQFPEARPHWGKYLLRPERVRERYPKMDQWLKVRAQFDPEGIFLNDFVARDLLALDKAGTTRDNLAPIRQLGPAAA